MMPSSHAIADEVAGNENAVGYYGMGYISPRQKVMAVAKDAKSPYRRADPDQRQIQHLSDLPAPVLLHQGRAAGRDQGFRRFRLLPGRPGDRQEDRFRAHQVKPPAERPRKVARMKSRAIKEFVIEKLIFLSGIASIVFVALIFVFLLREGVSLFKTTSARAIS